MSNSMIPSQTTKNESMIPAAAEVKPLAQLQLHEAPSKKKMMRMISDINGLIMRVLLQPQKILKVGRVTVVFWNDGSSTAVKCSEDAIPDDYAAFCAALGKKVFGTNTALKRAFMNAPSEIRES